MDPWWNPAAEFQAISLPSLSLKRKKLHRNPAAEFQAMGRILLLALLLQKYTFTCFTVQKYKC